MTLETLLPLFCNLLDWHPSRLKTLIQIILGMTASGSVRQIKAATGFSPDVQASSVCQRIRRFLKDQIFDRAVIARLVAALFTDGGPLHLAMDRTNWKFGRLDINLLVLAAVITPSLSIPLFAVTLPHQGNSGTAQRTDLLSAFLKAFPGRKIGSLTADREFVGEKWYLFLLKDKIPFYIRIKENSLFPYSKKKIHAREFFKHLRTGEKRFLELPFGGRRIYLAGTRCTEGDLLIVMSSQDKRHEILDIYRKRWTIEILFRHAKTNGFNMEDTALVHLERIEKLFLIVGIAIGLCWLFGKKQEALKKTPVKKTVGHPLFSTFRRGFDALRQHLFHRRETVFEFLAEVFSSLLVPCGAKV